MGLQPKIVPLLTIFALLTVLFQASKSSQDSPVPPPAKKRKIEWPEFHNNGASYTTQFENNTWRCPLCSYVTGRIKQHLTAKHKDVIQDWEGVERYCKDVSVMKRKELEWQRAQDPDRKDLKRKIDAQRADKPERKQVLRKADAKREDKRAGKPERKEVLRKADAKREDKRAEKPERKEQKRIIGKKVDSTNFFK